MPAEALPSFHVVWALLATEAMGASRRVRWPYRVWAAVVALSCVMTGVHSIADVMAGVLLSLVLLRAGGVWRGLRRLTEAIANSWREWRMGRIRVINHGVYAGAAAFTGLTIVGWLTGPQYTFMVALTGLAGLIGSGVWAQLVEGSPKLLRPFGYYGGIFSVMAISVLAPNPWLLMAAYSVAGPWIQSIGRLRCLVQGCCHGRAADPTNGIRYRHPRSRVCRLGGFEGVAVHATPLYSILWNVPVALVVTRLWIVSAPLGVIGGVYLILTGLGRFVEEAYRGEPQTPVYAGLRLYQWIAIATVVAGATITALVRAGNAAPPQFGWSAVGIAAVLGLLSAIALGIDFPESQRRFARLT
jgi:Prolipoprotein diacylglyceryl transferase/PAP2 superfamily